jgi:integrase
MTNFRTITSDFTIHDLRRTFASYQLLSTSDIRLVQQSLGHSSVLVTERYAHHQSAQLITATAKTADAMLPLHSLES